MRKILKLAPGFLVLTCFLLSPIFVQANIYKHHDHHHVQIQYSKTVFYNLKSRIWHNFSCRSAKQCTVNCVEMDLSEAIRRGGRACKVCGG